MCLSINNLYVLVCVLYAVCAAYKMLNEFEPHCVCAISQGEEQDELSCAAAAAAAAFSAAGLYFSLFTA